MWQRMRKRHGHMASERFKGRAGSLGVSLNQMFAPCVRQGSDCRSGSALSGGARHRPERVVYRVGVGSVPEPRRASGRACAGPMRGRCSERELKRSNRHSVQCEGKEAHPCIVRGGKGARGEGLVHQAGAAGAHLRQTDTRPAGWVPLVRGEIPQLQVVDKPCPSHDSPRAREFVARMLLRCWLARASPRGGMGVSFPHKLAAGRRAGPPRVGRTLGPYRIGAARQKPRRGEVAKGQPLGRAHGPPGRRRLGTHSYLK